MNIQYTKLDESTNRYYIPMYVIFLQIAELTVIPTGSTIQSHGMPSPVKLSDK